MNKKYKIILQNIFIVFFISIIALTSISYLLSFFYFNRVIKEKLIENFNNANANKYELSINQLNSNLLRGYILIKSAKITKNKNYRNKRKLYIQNIEIPIIEIKQINLFDLINNKQLKIAQFVVNNSRINFDYDTSIISLDTLDSVSKKKKQDKNFVQSINIQSLIINNSFLSIKNVATDSSLINLTGINVESREIIANSGVEEFIQSITNTGNVNFVIDKITYLEENRQNKIVLDSFAVNRTDSLIKIASLEIIPIKKSGKLDYSIAAKAENIDLKNIDFEKLILENIFQAKLFSIKKLKMKFSRNRNLKHKNTGFEILPHLALQQFNFPFSIDTLKAENSEMEYEWTEKGLLKTSRLILKKMKWNITHLSNINIYKFQNKEIQFNIEAFLMNRAFLKTNMRFPYHSSDGLHFVNGSLEKVPFQDFNPILEKSLSIKALSGELQSLSFHFKADSLKSEGNLIMKYNHLNLESLPNSKFSNPLKINLLEKVKQQKWLKSNPLPRKTLRIGKIEYFRENEKAITDFWWKSLLTGINNSIFEN